MATMKKSEILATAKRTVLNGILGDTLNDLGAERYGSDYNLAIPVTVDGIEVWVKVDLTAANYADTKVSKAFDPFVKREEYDAEQAVKAKEAEAKAKAREEKKARKA